MINIPPILANAKVQTDLLADITKTWKIGQVLNATAERNAQAHERVLIRMGQSILEAKTPIALKAGESITLQVKSLGDNPVLTINTAASTPQIAAHNLRSFIARQQDLTGLLQLGQKIINDPSTPALLKQLLKDLDRQIPTVRQATQPVVLKGLIQNSGVFLESRLNHREAEALQQDLKSQILKISALLRSYVQDLGSLRQSNAKPEMSSVNSLLGNPGLLKDFQSGLDGALARITSQQLTPLTREPDSPLLLLFDLYIKDKDENNLVHFLLEQETSAQREKASNWKITLDFEFIELGAVQAQLHLYGNSISTVVVAEQRDTVNGIEENIDLLHTALDKIGFEAVKLVVREGSISRSNNIADSVRIVDENA